MMPFPVSICRQEAGVAIGDILDINSLFSGQIVRALEGDAVSFDEGLRPGQSSQFSSGSDFDSGTYSSKMRQFQKVAMASGEYTGEYSGMTSEYGLNPSESSNSSEEMNIGAGHKPRQGV